MSIASVSEASRLAVYVDALRQWGGSAGFRWKQSCHMYADSLEELHRFATRIGMKRAWFQNDGRLPHYDLTVTRRRKALTLGAVEQTDREMVRHMRKADG